MGSPYKLFLGWWKDAAVGGPRREAPQVETASRAPASERGALTRGDPICCASPFSPCRRCSWPPRAIGSPKRSETGLAAHDTVQAGDSALDAGVLRPFSLLRKLTLTRGDTVKPFGRQSEQLAPATLDGRPVLLDVLTFETPNATTVDSSWIDPQTLQPIRMRSSNSSRVVALDFDGRRVRGGTTPASGPATALDQELGVRPFEWNMFGLAVSALPLRPGYRATLPVYVDRYHRVVWYAIEVLRDTSIVRASGFHAPMWEVLATADSVAPSARLWVSQRHRFVDQVLVWEPGVSIMYAR